MRKLFLMLTILFSIVFVQAQHINYKSVTNIAAFKELFTVAAQKIQTLKSDFVQEKNLTLLSEKITSKGKFWFKKDNLVRMEYQQPYKYLMIINKNNVFVKDGQKENKISTKSNKLFQQINKITMDCVQGTVLNNSDFKVNVFENAQNYLIDLTPITKEMITYFKNIQVIISKKDYAVNKIEMNEATGDNTTISFLNKELNPTLQDALFAIK